MDVETALRRIEGEYIKATSEFGKFHDAHHGYAVLEEEVDELWEEVKRKPKDTEKMRKEAIQVATMAIRFLVDCC